MKVIRATHISPPRIKCTSNHCSEQRANFWRRNEVTAPTSAPNTRYIETFSAIQRFVHKLIEANLFIVSRINDAADVFSGRRHR
jgi:hypothetical protein